MFAYVVRDRYEDDPAKRDAYQDQPSIANPEQLDKPAKYPVVA